jgi:hypothetical protein
LIHRSSLIVSIDYIYGRDLYLRSLLLPRRRRRRRRSRWWRRWGRRGRGSGRIITGVVNTLTSHSIVSIIARG